MKHKQIINYSIILIVVITVYIIFVLTIDKIIPTYDGKFEEHSVDELVSVIDSDGEILNFLDICNELNMNYMLSEEETQELENNENVSSILKYIKGTYDIDIKHDETYCVKNTPLGDIYSIVGYSKEQYNYSLVFTLDFKNINLICYYYQYESDLEVLDLDPEKVSKEKMLENVGKQLEEMKIPMEKEFSLSTVYLREYDIITTYLVKDEENSLEIVYGVNQQRIISLNKGFENIEEYIEKYENTEKMGDPSYGESSESIGC